MSSKKWTIYILRCSDTTLYTGITTDIQRRLQEHLSGKGAKYTQYRTPLKLVYTETAFSRSQASKREITIKALSRQKKQLLIQQHSLSLDQLA